MDFRNNPAPIPRRRELARSELEAAARQMALGLALGRVASDLGVMPSVLRRQLLQMLWQLWCETRGIDPGPGPVDLSF